MSLSRAWQRFCQELFEPYCNHSHVHTHGEHCPDCGDRIQLVWTQVRCRGCDVRRRPKEKMNGQVGALTPYCRFCGSHQIRLVKKHHIERYEMPYSILSRESDYQESEVGVFRGRKPYASPPEAQAYNAQGNKVNPFAQQTVTDVPHKSTQELMFGLRQFMNDERKPSRTQSTFRSIMDVDLTQRANPFKPVVDGDVLSSEYLN